MRPDHRGTILLVAIVIITTFVKVVQLGFALSDAAAMVANFKQCVAIGNPIMETSPRQCYSGDTIFVEVIEDAATGTALTLQ